MYAERFGTDWEDIDSEEALERAYALGVAEELGEGYDEEYDRLESVMGNSYEKSMLELSYKDGKREAAGLKDLSDEETWSELVEEEDLEEATTDIDPPDEEEPPSDTRSAVSRGEMLDREDRDSTDAVSRPDFLERD